MNYTDQSPTQVHVSNVDLEQIKLDKTWVEYWEARNAYYADRTDEHLQRFISALNAVSTVETQARAVIK